MGGGGGFLGYSKHFENSHHKIGQMASDEGGAADDRVAVEQAQSGAQVQCCFTSAETMLKTIRDPRPGHPP